MTPAKISAYLVLFIGIEHVWIMVIEAFLWKKTAANDLLGFDADTAAKTEAMARNMGLYNGFLAAGLLWGYAAETNSANIRTFFLWCVLLAGIVGGKTLSKKIYVLQGLPAGITLLLNYFFYL